MNYNDNLKNRGLRSPINVHLKKTFEPITDDLKAVRKNHMIQTRNTGETDDYEVDEDDSESDSWKKTGDSDEPVG